MSTIHDALQKAKQTREELATPIPGASAGDVPEPRKGRRVVVGLVLAGLILLALAGLSWFKGTFTKTGEQGDAAPVALAKKSPEPPLRPAPEKRMTPPPAPAHAAPARPRGPDKAPGAAVPPPPPPPARPDPEAQALYEQALAAQTQGDLSRAEEIYRQSLAREPSFDKSLNNLGVILMGRGQNADARRNFLTAIRQNPAYADAYYNLACLSAREKSLPQALAFLRQALHLDPNSREYALKDPDLEPLSGMKEFIELVSPEPEASKATVSK